MLTSSISKVTSSPARGWLASKVTWSSVISRTTTSSSSSSSLERLSSSPTSGIRSSGSSLRGTVKIFSLSYSPNASAAAILTVFFSPGVMPTIAASICGKRISSPRTKVIGPLSCPPQPHSSSSSQPSSQHSSSLHSMSSRVESNTVPSSSVPVKLIVTVFPFSANAIDCLSLLCKVIWYGLLGYGSVLTSSRYILLTTGIRYYK